VKPPLTIKETQEGLFDGKFTAVDLVNEYLARIEKNDKEINSYITVANEEAYSQAKKADSLIQKEGRKVLNQKSLIGCVVSHKDLFLTKGVRTTAASNVLKSYVPPYSATAVKRIDNAGAVMIGKLNCDAWAHGASGENSDFGLTKNPWNTKHVPGGSSSGSAASVAASFSLFSTGTDTGGSVRQPANFCGIVGLKPTYGVVPRYGVVAMASSLDTIGHMARTVEDAKKIFDVVKGKDGYDATLKGESGKFNKKKIKIGIPKEYFVEGLDEEVEKAVIDASQVFKKDGVEIVEISLPHTKYAISVYYIIQPAEVSSNLGRYDGVRYGNERSSFGQEAKRRIMLGTYVLSAGYYDAYYLKAMKVRSMVIEDFESAFRDVDAILAPVSPTPAFKLGSKTDDPLQMYLADVLTVAANLAGLPGLAIPSGFTEDKLPLGFQLIGPRFSEKLLFDIGERYEKLTDYKPKSAI
jgi:aspartyl-tRNA(Asn)/glutamyl-tRNA(Gln) amidotransferase subunit A